MHTMRPVLWGLHHIQGLNLHQLRQLDHHILLQGLKQCTRLHPSYLLATIVVILPTKLMNATFLSRISFVIIVGKMDLKNLSVLPSFETEATSIIMEKFTNIFHNPSSKSQGTSAFHSGFTHQR